MKPKGLETDLKFQPPLKVAFTAQSDDLVAYVKLYLGANKLNQMIPLKEPTQTKQFIWPGLNVVSRNKNLEWLFDCGD